MPIRVNILTPGEFIRDHLVNAGGVDFVQSIYTDYKGYLLGQEVQKVCTRATMSYYIWLCNQLGLIAFDHAEAVNYWDSTPDALTPPPNYVRESRPQAPSPRHYYRILDPNDARWPRLQAAYRADRGFEEPKHVKRLYPEKQTDPLTPSEIEAVRWALANASDFWQTEEFKKGRTGDEPRIVGNILIIPEGSLTRDYVSDLIGRLQQYQEMRRAAIPRPPGREGARILNQIRYAQRVTAQLQSLLKQLRAPVKRPKPTVTAAAAPTVVETPPPEEKAVRGRPRVREARQPVARAAPTPAAVARKEYLDALVRQFETDVRNILPKLDRLAQAPGLALEQEIETDLFNISERLVQTAGNLPQVDVAVLENINIRLRETLENIPLLRTSLQRVLTTRPGFREEADRRAYANAVSVFKELMTRVQD